MSKQPVKSKVSAENGKKESRRKKNETEGKVQTIKTDQADEKDSSNQPGTPPAIDPEMAKTFDLVCNKAKEDNNIYLWQGFADKVDTSPTTLSGVRNGRRPISIEMLKTLMDVFNINPVFILSKGKRGNIYLTESSDNHDNINDKHRREIERLTTENSTLKEENSKLLKSSNEYLLKMNDLLVERLSHSPAPQKKIV